MTDLSATETCARCSYDLRGLEKSGNCPECGAPIEQNCVECGRDVRHCNPNGFCPRCGRAVFTVPPNEHLSSASPEALRAIMRPLDLMYYGILGVISVMIAAAVNSLQMIAISVIAPALMLVTLPLAICGLILAIISPIAIALGVWGLGNVPPWRTDNPLRHRTIYRSICAGIAALLLALGGLYISAAQHTLTTLTFGVELAFILLITAAGLMILIRFRTLERRSGSYRFSRHRIFRQHLGAVPTILALFLVVDIIMPAQTPGHTEMTVVGPTFLIILLTLIPIDKTRQIVATCAQEARQRRSNGAREGVLLETDELPTIPSL